MSTSINKKGTYDTPTINFDPHKGLFSISGRSLPANTFNFYSSIMNELFSYLSNPQELSKFEFKMDFINSSSTKIFQELFHELQEAHNRGVKIIVNWYYKFGDEDMKEFGDDLRQDSTFPFEFIAYE